MTKIFLLLALLPMTTFAAGEFRVRNQAANEIYDHLALSPVEVRDEHGGNAYALAKYGRELGCQRSLEGGTTECWFSATSYRGTFSGTAALELYRALDLQEETVVDPDGSIFLNSAKYGKTFGCELTAGNSASCWFN